MITLKSENVSQDKRDKLLENLDTLKQGIPDLNKYVDDSTNDLDVGFVQERTDQLVEWYERLKSDVAAAQGGNTNETCDVQCPNARWNYDADVCSCTCDVQNCNNGEVFDPWGCQCVEQTDCTETSESCGDEILDYATCTCKPAP
ncbi:CLUMA_CG018667, isoform A [Clunio marinus]|uniref:CLUMA_CG018667, isoform A n=1 Tax=Clunio marinus TaxID=568069 RepID=A0A1J1J0L9_9DIPT|nr:CLUMA_CG018667, isoform A [Clunio marinus]